MIRIVLATRNDGKIREFREILSAMDFELVSMKDFQDFPDVIEDGDSFSANALKKAVASASFTGLISLADDSGLEVVALNGAPGVMTARYSGEDATDVRNNMKLLNALKGLPAMARLASFKCAIAVAIPDHMREVAVGECKGRISLEMKGSQGFGYDPVFIPEGFEDTFAELGPVIKNRISHRAVAFKKMRKMLEKLLV